MGLTVLTDEQVSNLLNALTVDELETFRKTLQEALYDYSTGTQTVQDGEVQQPPRTTVLSPTTGATTLFMPSLNLQGIGMKVLTLSPGGVTDRSDLPVIQPTGTITLYASTGSPLGVLHARTLTAFRTALASSCLIIRRSAVRTVTVFGCGEQAYWHVRLALLLRGPAVRRVHVIGRHFESCRKFVKRFFALPAAVRASEGWSETQFSLLTASHVEYPRLVSETLRSSDVIFCCTPATAPLFEDRILTSHEGRRKGRLIVAIGSCTHAMHELPTGLLLQATSNNEHMRGADSHHRHFHKHAVEGGVIVVDTLDGALKEAGEIVAAGLSPASLVELGELVMLARIKDNEVDASSASTTPTTTSTSTSTAVASTATTPRHSLDLDRLTMSSGNAMASVYAADPGKDAGSEKEKSPTTRTSLPSRTPSVSSLLLNTLSHATSGGSSSSSTNTPTGHRNRSRHRQRKTDDHRSRWLHDGNVIYKSVGLGLMDLSVGLHLIEFARQKGVGTTIDGF